MKKVLITGAGSYVGTKVEKWLQQYPEDFQVDAVDTINDNWKKADFSKYDVVYNVAGIAHVKAAKGEGPLYYAINRDMVIDIARTAKIAGVKQFIHMSSMIVYWKVREFIRIRCQHLMAFMETQSYRARKAYGNLTVQRLKCVFFVLL